VAQRLLHDLQVGPVLPEMAREGMTQHVRVDGTPDDRGHRPPDELEDRLRAQRQAGPVRQPAARVMGVDEDEWRSRRRGDQFGPEAFRFLAGMRLEVQIYPTPWRSDQLLPGDSSTRQPSGRPTSAGLTLSR
jgi:hypothetical protein